MNLAHDALLPRRPGGMAPGAALALLVHGLLLGALALGVNWRMTAPEVVSAELWAAVPQVAAPRAEEPPPAPAPAPEPPKPAPAPAPAPPPQAAPTEAQIAIERAEKRRLQREQQEEQAKAKAKAAADAAAEKKRLADEKKREADEKKRELAEQKAEEARTAQAREEQLKRMMGALPTSPQGTPGSTGSASRDAAPSQAYVGLLVRKIRSNWVYTGALNGNPAAEVEVVAAAGGSIIARRLVKSSGNPDYDESVLRAIDRTRTLPRDTDGRVPPSLIITFRPKE